MIAELLTLAALTWQDPSGDAHGAGDLAPPTAEVYSSLAPFDLVEASVLDDALLVVEVRLAGIPDPGGLPNGLTLPVVDVYLDTGEGGREELLAGPEMAMPPGRGWELAFRVHGDDAYLVDAGDPDARPRPVAVTRRGDVLRLETGLARPEEIRDLHALTGVYDPFRSDAWRPLADAPSPWAFASETPAPPVVDLLADDDAAQRDALRAFTLPTRRTRSGSVPWLVLMLAGLGVAIVGLGLRRRVPVEGASGDAAEPSDERGHADAPDAADADVQGTDGANAHESAADDAPTISAAGAAGAVAPLVGRASRAAGRAPRADAEATGTAGAAAHPGDDGARVLRTTWAGRDGWWVEGVESDDTPRETLWDATAEEPDEVDAPPAARAAGAPDADAHEDAPEPEPEAADTEEDEDEDEDHRASDDGDAAERANEPELDADDEERTPDRTG